MATLSSSIRNLDFDITCEKCGCNFSFKGRDINHDVQCPACRTVIHLDGTEFDKALKDAQRELDNFLKGF